MSEAFNVNQYWIDRGRGYAGESFPRDYHRLQEQFLLHSLASARVPFRRILDLGCGFGRITRLLADAWPAAIVTAVDLSEDQLQNARKYCEGRGNIEFATYDFYSNAPIPGAPHDVVVAVEVFLHHPETVLRQLLRRLSGACDYIVNIDWSEEWPWPRPEHVWIHHYTAIYSELSLECASLPLPERVNELQQKLFFAARKLPDAIRTHGQPESQRLAEPPAAAQWYLQLERAIADLRRVVPENASLILVNDDQWGSAQARLSPRRVWPFLERGGKFWGRPADDATAIEELTRMQQEGATHIAFAWHCFWWLEHYTAFAAHLRNFPCALANDCVMIFKLRA